MKEYIAVVRSHESKVVPEKMLKKAYNTLPHRAGKKDGKWIDSKTALRREWQATIKYYKGGIKVGAA